MRHVNYHMLAVLIIDVLLIPLMGKGYVPCSNLIISSTGINLATVTLIYINLLACRQYLLIDYDLYN